LGQQSWKLLSQECKETKPSCRREPSLFLQTEDQLELQVPSSKSCAPWRSSLCHPWKFFDSQTGGVVSLFSTTEAFPFIPKWSFLGVLVTRALLLRAFLLTKALLLFRVLGQSLSAWARFLRANLLIDSIALFLLNWSLFHLLVEFQIVISQSLTFCSNPLKRLSDFLSQGCRLKLLENLLSSLLLAFRVLQHLSQIELGRNGCPLLSWVSVKCFSRRKIGDAESRSTKRGRVGSNRLRLLQTCELVTSFTDGMSGAEASN
jgi:hypothetical protein